MEIKAGTKLRVFHRRHGAFNGIASKDFNTEEDEFYPIVLDDDCVEGLSTTFYKGDNMPLRNIFCEIEIVKDINMEEKNNANLAN